MNRVFTTVWNHSLGAWTVASEHASRQGKRSTSKGQRIGSVALLSATLFSPVQAVAADLPAGGQIVQGSGQIGTPSTNQMVIDQASNKLAINWQSFDIAAGNKVTFNQPGSDSIALNRVLGADGSRIMGQLDANGRVFIVNPNGVLFGQGAQVNVGGLVASTLDISDADFAAGNYQFKGDGNNAGVINQGSINARNGGAIALLGGTVSNQGVIVANRGTVALAAGNKITLDFAGDGLLNVQVDEAAVDALVENHQLIKADGGQVLLTANAGDALLKTVVNNTGVIEAQTLGEKDGKIVLLGGFDGGSVQVAGTLDASAPTGGNGGFIETSGAHVQIADTAKVTTKAQSGKTGTWLIDPNDFTIAASGGNMTGAAVSTAVQNNNFEIQTATQGSSGGNGDILVNDALTWSSGNTLTLTAERNIEINANITAPNGGLTLNAQNSISATDAVNVGTFTLANGNWKQFGPILPAFSAKDFRLNGGSFLRALGGDGSSASPWQLTDVYGLQGMGGFLDKNSSLANNLDASGTASWSGGLGFNPIGTGFGSYSGTFDGLGHTISGLTINRGTQDYVGLFGATSGATIHNIGLQGGSISGRGSVGGLVGDNYSSSISNAYATGEVTGNTYVGGLVGYNASSTISNAYATGTVTGNTYVGGLVGYNAIGIISNAYATGRVTGTNDVGGLVGYRDSGSISQSYWDISRSGQSTSSGGTGLTTAQMMTASSFTGWNIATTGGSSSVWRIYEGQTGPLLRSFLTAVTVTPTNLTGKTYDGTLASGTFTYTPSLTDAVLAGSATYTSQSANAGTYSAANGGLTLGGLYSGQQGYDISYASDSSLTITPKALSWINLAVDNKEYDGNATAAINKGSLTGYVSGEGLISGSTAAFADQNAGNGKTVTVHTTLGNGSGRGLASNYTIADTTVTASITPKTLTLTGVAAGNKTYDGTKAAAITGGTLSGMIGGETVGLGALSGSFADQNAGNGIAVTVTGGTLSNGSNGGRASNYTIGSVTGLSANIAQKALTVTGVTVASKAYDGTTSATVSGGTLNGLVSGETLTLSGLSGAFGDKNAGNGKAVTVTGFTWSDGSGLASNYTVSNATGATGNITPKALTVTGATAADKVYDGSTAATVNGGSLSGLVSGETLGLSSLTGVFGDKNAASGKAVTVTGGALSDGTGGGLASNYTVGPVTGLSASITQKALTLSGLAASAKAYDGNTKATLTGGTLDGLVTGETLSVSGQTGTFSDKNAGTGKVVTVTGTTLVDGSGLASNYSLANPTGVTGDITKKALTITGITATNRAYTGGTAVSLGGTVILDGLVGAEGFGVGGMVGVFADKNVGTGKAVTITGAVMTVGSNGGLASNYTISNPTGVTANITKATISAVTNIVIDDKVYDGGLNAIVNAAGATFGGIKSGDSLTVNATTATFADKNVGTGKAVTISGIGLGGTDAGNYNLTTTTGSSTGAITPKALTIIGMSAVNKVYDGNTKASVTGGSIDGLVGLETLGVTGLTVTFDDKNAGTGKAVTATGTTLVNGGNGGLASNYTMANPTGFTANITPKALTVTGVSASDKVYDGNTGAVLVGGTLNGLITGETLALSGMTGTFAGMNAGTGKTVTVSGTTLADGTGWASNYTVVNPVGLTANINKAGLTITANDASKTYDGIAYSGGNGVSYSGFVNNEDETVLGGTLVYGGSAQNAINAGSYSIAATGLTSGNYDLAFNDGTLQIAAAPVQPPVTPEPPQEAQTLQYAAARNSAREHRLSQPATNLSSQDSSPAYDIVDSGIRLPEGI